jgi:RNA polymerase sigma-70 factor (ECF subfamily)
MPPSEAESTAFTRQPLAFVTTHWSVVLAAGQDDSSNSASALEKLCAAYWYPLYAHVRRRGHDADTARDLTQGFFAEVLAKGSIAAADSARGRFRTFLLAALDNFLHHHHRDANALKRGGGREIISWDDRGAEQRYALEPLDECAPDRAFDRRWALATLETVRGRLRNELSVSSKAELFDLLRPHLFGEVDATPYAQIAVRLGMTTGALKLTVHRLRRRYRELLREEVAHTLANPSDADQEIQHLVAALSGQ